MVALSDWSPPIRRISMASTSPTSTDSSLGDVGLAGIVEAGVAAVVDLGAQAAQVEEQRLLRRGGAGADDRPVAQDEVLHGRADPPGGVGREADVALGLEPGGRLHQADDALLDEVAERQAVVLEPAGGADHEAHVGLDQLVQRRLVVVVAPAPGEMQLVLAASEAGRSSTHG